MLVYLDDEMAIALLDLLNTEDAFGTLPKCLERTIKDLEEKL